MRTSIKLFALVLALCLGCGGNHDPNVSTPGTPGGDNTGGSNDNTGMPTVPVPPDGLAPGIQRMNVSGRLVDFVSGAALGGSPMLTVSGMSPAPMMTENGADFLIQGIPPITTFYLVANDMDYDPTYSMPVKVQSSDMSGLDVPVVKTAYAASLASGFQVTPATDTAMVLVRAVDANGKALAGVPAGAFSLAGATGPFFLDDMLQPKADLMATSSSGWAVFFDVAAGSPQLAATAAGWTLTGDAIPTAKNAVSLAQVIASMGTTPTPMPSSVSFMTDVVPIFTKRGCTNCHSGNGIGRQETGFTLDNSIIVDYRQVAQTVSDNFDTLRIDLANPANSLILRMPSYSATPTGHPTVIFTSHTDPDYVTILNWVTQGGKMN
jgi:hypothetical protein